MQIKLLSWNVNGIRAVHKKGAFEILDQHKPDIFCIQETKAHPEQLSDTLTNIPGYQVFFSSAEKKGYSGVAIYTSMAPKRVERGFDIEKFDSEGRILIADFDQFTLFNIYFPNGKASKERLQYKMAFYEAFLEYVKDVAEDGKDIVLCGDVNTAHREIDLARPKQNETVSGFLPEEREWIDKFIDSGFVDTFRLFNEQGEQYTWWDYKTRARDRNVGWRIDYFFVNDRIAPMVKSSFILAEVLGSDHCPIGIEIEMD